MDKYPTKKDFEVFVDVIKSGKYSVSKYLPPIHTRWYAVISDCIEYVEHTASYEELSFEEQCAKILYKVAKRHELGDGNKRSSVIAVYLFCLVNDRYIVDPSVIKKQAKRIASTKGRMNEAILRKRVATVLEKVIKDV
jgi:prophage maintenance system killer protein